MLGACSVDGGGLVSCSQTLSGGGERERSVPDTPRNGGGGGGGGGATSGCQAAIYTYTVTRRSSLPRSIYRACVPPTRDGDFACMRKLFSNVYSVYAA